MRLTRALSLLLLSLTLAACSGAPAKETPASAPAPHKRPDGVEVVAHRGGLPENSLSAFRKAIATPGVGAIELDIQMTRDLVPVIMHDARVDRTTNGTGLVGNMTAAEVKALKTPKEGAGEPVPTLEEVLQLVAAHPDKRLLLEIKYPTPKETPKIVVDLLRKQKVEAQTVVISFNLPILEQVQQLAPHLGTGYLLSAVGDESYAKFKGEYLGVRYTALTPEVAAKLKATGKYLYAWTVNEDAQMQAMLERKVDGLISDTYETAVRVRDAHR